MAFARSPRGLRAGIGRVLVAALFGCGGGTASLDLSRFDSAVVMFSDGGAASAAAFSTSSPWKEELARGTQVAVLAYDRPLDVVGLPKGRIPIQVDGPPFPEPTETFGVDLSESTEFTSGRPGALRDFGIVDQTNPCDPPRVELLEVPSGDVVSLVSLGSGAMALTSTGAFFVVDEGGVRVLARSESYPRGPAAFHEPSGEVWIVGQDGATIHGRPGAGFEAGPRMPAEGALVSAASRTGDFELFVKTSSGAVFRLAGGEWQKLGDDSNSVVHLSIAWTGPGAAWATGSSYFDVEMFGAGVRRTLPFVGTISSPTEGSLRFVVNLPTLGTFVGLDGGNVYSQESQWTGHPSGFGDAIQVFEIHGTPWSLGVHGPYVGVGPIGKGCEATILSRPRVEPSLAQAGSVVYLAGINEAGVARLVWE